MYLTKDEQRLSEGCPKIGDVPKSPFYAVAALVPSAGTVTRQIESQSDAGAQAPAPRRARIRLRSSPGSLPDVVLCPDVLASIFRRLDRRDLP
jgi:hypothetical protein